MSKHKRSFGYLREMGAILDPSGRLLHIAEGTAGNVDFPSETIWELHKKSPGIVHLLTHIHPPGMTRLSGRDELTLRTWAYALYPFPIRIATIAETHFDPFNQYTFRETIYLAVLESKEAWIARGKQGPRNFAIVVEGEKVHYTNPQNLFPGGWYGTLLLEKSYGLRK